MGDFGVYVHVPFCARRCGYCDFNTYTPEQLRAVDVDVDTPRRERGAARSGPESIVSSYPTSAMGEIALAAARLTDDGYPIRPASTVFFGGGTPTVLPSGDLVAILRAIAETWGLAPDAEVTTEANPDSVTRDSLQELAEGGFTRVSFGMQSAIPHVLHTLDRPHDPERVPDVVRWARECGLAVSLDLIYGTPGESLADWRRSVEAALATGVDHLSAYALTVVPGTAMHRRIARGALPAPDDDDEAAKYELADDLLAAAGLEWYEISNWARGGIAGPNVCRHNLGYWRGADWWGVGPGAHSYLGPNSAGANPFGRRWWNVKHPRRYAELVDAGRLPVEGEEALSAQEARMERIMLETRLADGLPLGALPEATARTTTRALVEQGLIAPEPLGLDEAGLRNIDRRAVLTRRGRLLADTVVRALTD